MPKGRTCVPTRDGDGIWFPHRGLPDTGPPLREACTSTGVMLSSPYRAHSAVYPPSPPKPYLEKNTRNFKTSNNFSAHDNRHSFQDHGLYFGDGNETRTLGKNITPSEYRQHNTDKDFLKHYGRHVVNYDYNTVYDKNYVGNQDTRRPSTRRFPKIHQEGSPDKAKLATTTSTWFTEPDVPHKTPTHVLAVSQEPFLPSNKWKYSNHGSAKCYPPYDIPESSPEYRASWSANRVVVKPLRGIKTQTEGVRA